MSSFNEIIGRKPVFLGYKNYLNWSPFNRLSGRWSKVSIRTVCFGTRKNQFGRFYVRRGRLTLIKLVHRRGSVTYNINNVNSPLSNWGCGGTEVNVVVTNSRNAVLLPPRKFLSKDPFLARLKWSVIPGYNSFSPELVLPFSPSPFVVYSPQELRLWYGEDLMDFAEEDNRGSLCVLVYALFAWWGAVTVFSKIKG